MSRTTPQVPHEKLSRWHFAVSHAVFRLKQHVCEMELRGDDPTYDMKQLEALSDLDMFLSMSWEEWLDDLTQTSRQHQEDQTNV